MFSGRAKSRTKFQENLILRDFSARGACRPGLAWGTESAKVSNVECVVLRICALTFERWSCNCPRRCFFCPRKLNASYCASGLSCSTVGRVSLHGNVSLHSQNDYKIAPKRCHHFIKPSESKTHNAPQIVLKQKGGSKFPPFVL